MVPAVNSRAPISIVRGNLKIYVNQPELLPQVMSHLTSGEGHVGVLAMATARLLDGAATFAGGASIKSLRDLRYTYRGSLSTGSDRFVQDLNAAYKLLRHNAQKDIDNMIEGVILDISNAPQPSRDVSTSLGSTQSDDGSTPTSDIREFCDPNPVGTVRRVNDEYKNNVIDETMYLDDSPDDSYLPWLQQWKENGNVFLSRFVETATRFNELDEVAQCMEGEMQQKDKHVSTENHRSSVESVRCCVADSVEVDIEVEAGFVLDGIVRMKPGQYDECIARSRSHIMVSDEDMELVFNMLSCTNARNFGSVARPKHLHGDQIARLFSRARELFELRCRIAVEVLCKHSEQDAKTWKRMANIASREFSSHANEVECQWLNSLPCKAQLQQPKASHRRKFKGVTQR
eukprot:TRINITY_DN74628_c0_g1_i1.p1 TRINITY_DN74628_c0_g1~~TRINITY_DN74628_c0_g1_i1.p1  ORF type:complete len:402 (+),score=78.90 TRINITY_DN74628_c0_g1_i1:51-1256(+)